MRDEYIQGKTTLKEVFAILDACEAANLKHLVRIKKLEQLCRDMYYYMEQCEGSKIIPCSKDYEHDMEVFGLINTNSVHSENEVLLDQHFKDAEGKTPTEQLEALIEACRKQVD